MRLKKTYFGEGCLERLGDILSYYQPKTIFILTGKRSFEESNLKSQLENIFNSAKIKAIYFSDFENNPKIEDVYKGIKLVQQNQIDLMIAIGGGSVLDIAKMINLFAQPANNLQDYLDQKPTSIQERAKPWVAIPTTAGTGSEATHFSVLYINKEKYSVAHPFMLPKHTLIDPLLTYSATPYLTATTGFDAFTQAIESFWSVHSTTKSQHYAKRAIRLCMQFLIMTVQNPTPLARRKMALAAYLAGKAIDISKTTAPHALSYAMTMHYGIAHGHAVALTMPLFMKINANFEHPINDSRGKAYLKNKLDELFQLFGCKNASDCAMLFSELMQKAGLKTDFKSLGITKHTDFQFLVNSINLDRMKNNPVQISSNELLEHLTQC